LHIEAVPHLFPVLGSLSFALALNYLEHSPYYSADLVAAAAAAADKAYLSLEERLIAEVVIVAETEKRTGSCFPYNC
jgi:hypothetical protein